MWNFCKFITKENKLMGRWVMNRNKQFTEETIWMPFTLMRKMPDLLSDQRIPNLSNNEIALYIHPIDTNLNIC